MGRAIDLFVTYRFIRLLTTPFEKTDAFKMRSSTKTVIEQIRNCTRLMRKNAYTILHKLVFNIKKLFAKVLYFRTKVGTYADASFYSKILSKNTLKTLKCLRRNS